MIKHENYHDQRRKLSIPRCRLLRLGAHLQPELQAQKIAVEQKHAMHTFI